MGDNVLVKVKTLGKGKGELQITVPADISVPDLKEKLAEVSEVPASQQRLIYLGKVLKDDQKLSDYNFRPGGSLHLVASAPPRTEPQPTNPTPPTSTNTSNPNQSPSQSTPNVVMGVLPAGNGSSLDQILSNVLGSIGLNSSDASNENNPPFTNLRNIVQSLENQVNSPTGSSVMESP